MNATLQRPVDPRQEELLLETSEMSAKTHSREIATFQRGFLPRKGFSSLMKMRENAAAFLYREWNVEMGMRVDERSAKIIV